MKIDCSITENFLKEKNRMTKNCTIDCNDCCLYHLEDEYSCSCIKFERDYPKETIAAVQHWSDEHPQKTMLQDFLEKYPNAKKYDSGLPKCCPHMLGYTDKTCSDFMFCKECWNQPLPDEV